MFIFPFLLCSYCCFFYFTPPSSTNKGMDMLWHSQNPNDCRTAKYLIPEIYPTGFGSEVHIMGAAMSIAMESGRVLLQPLGGWQWRYHNAHCRGQKHHDSGSSANLQTGHDIFLSHYSAASPTPPSPTSPSSPRGLECYFKPLSRCTLEDAFESMCANKPPAPSYYPTLAQNNTDKTGEGGGTSGGWPIQWDEALVSAVVAHGSVGQWVRVAQAVLASPLAKASLSSAGGGYRPRHMDAACFVRWFYGGVREKTLKDKKLVRKNHAVNRR